MDVGAPSNFERLLWTFPDTARLRTVLHAGSVDDDAIRATIAAHARTHGEVLCPHTATAIHALDSLAPDGTWAVVATAHPAKFESIVEPIIGEPVTPPPALAALLARPAHADPMPADYAAFRAQLEAR